LSDREGQRNQPGDERDSEGQQGNALIALPPDEEPEGNQAHRMRRHQIRMQQSAAHALAHRRMGDCDIGSGDGNKDEDEPNAAVHSSRLKRTASKMGTADRIMQRR
jgi:hypothetical protein